MLIVDSFRLQGSGPAELYHLPSGRGYSGLKAQAWGQPCHSSNLIRLSIRQSVADQE